MTRARGQAPRSLLNREFPHQIILLADTVGGRELDRVIKFHDKLSVPIKSRSAFQNDQWYAIYCFAEKEHALAFRLAFGGTLIDRPLPPPRDTCSTFGEAAVNDRNESRKTELAN